MNYAIKLLIGALIIVGVYLFSLFSGTISFFDYRIFDLLSKNREIPFTQESNSTVVVEIDEASLEEFGQWPWPRLLLAIGLENILKQRPAAVGIDIFFPEPDRTSPVELIKFYRQRIGLDATLNGLPQELSDHDQLLASALQNSPTVLPLFAEKNLSSHSSVDPQNFLPLPDELALATIEQLRPNTEKLQQAATGFGYINAAVDNDGIFRRLPLLMSYRGMAVPSLTLAMLLQVDPTLQIIPPTGFWSPATVTFADKKISINRHGEILNQLYSPEAFQKISMLDVINGDIPPSFLSGKLILIGATAAGLFDQYMTPSGSIVPGVFVHAALLENITHDNNLYQLEISKKLALALSLLCSILVVWMVFKRYYLIAWAIYLGTSVTVLMFGWLQLQQGRYLSIGYFLTPFSLLFFFISLFFAVLHFFERKRFLEDLGEAHSATIDSMTMVAESRDVETGGHIIRTKEYVRLLADYLHLNSTHRTYLTPHVIELLYRAAPLHDIGKVGIPDAILQKPGKLNQQERKIMNSHVEIGHSIIENAINSYNKTNEFLTIASNITYSHHEKWDGSGYPLGLKGEEIPLEGRIMALADVYDALISSRCYKESFSFEQAEKIITDDMDKHFDPLITAAFTACKDQFREIALKYNEGKVCKLPKKLKVSNRERLKVSGSLHIDEA
jgi:adenylate cyclase